MRRGPKSIAAGFAAAGRADAAAAVVAAAEMIIVDMRGSLKSRGGEHALHRPSCIERHGETLAPSERECAAGKDAGDEAGGVRPMRRAACHWRRPRGRGPGYVGTA